MLSTVGEKANTRAPQSKQETRAGLTVMLRKSQRGHSIFRKNENVNVRGVLFEVHKGSFTGMRLRGLTKNLPSEDSIERPR